MTSLSLIDKTFLLKKTVLFSTLDLEMLLAIADKCEVLNFVEREVLFTYKQGAHRLYIIAQGEVSINTPSETDVAALKEGEYFGEEALLNDRPREYEAVSQTSTLLLTISRSTLLSILAECPTVAINLCQEYAKTVSFRHRQQPKTP